MGVTRILGLPIQVSSLLMPNSVNPGQISIFAPYQSEETTLPHTFAKATEDPTTAAKYIRMVIPGSLMPKLPFAVSLVFSANLVNIDRYH